MATIKELGDGGPDGTRLGKTAASLVSFYGATPQAQATAITTVTFTNFTVAAGSDAVNDIIAKLKAVGLTA